MTPKAPVPIQQGKHIPSQMLRVDSKFADAVRAEAKRSDVKVTVVTRHIYEALYNINGER